MVKPLRAIVGVKPDPKSFKVSPERNPNNRNVKDDEGKFIDDMEDGVTAVDDVQGNDNRSSSMKKTHGEAPNVGLVDPMKKISEDVDQIDELDKKTLKSYRRKAATHVDRLEKKADQEEDKAMSTDGYRYPDKQDRHSRNAKALFQKSRQRRKGLAMADKRLEK
jgi:hypothetical protein